MSVLLAMRGGPAHWTRLVRQQSVHSLWCRRHSNKTVIKESDERNLTPREIACFTLLISGITLYSEQEYRLKMAAYHAIKRNPLTHIGEGQNEAQETTMEFMDLNAALQSQQPFPETPLNNLVLLSGVLDSPDALSLDDPKLRLRDQNYVEHDQPLLLIEYSVKMYQWNKKSRKVWSASVEVPPASLPQPPSVARINDLQVLGHHEIRVSDCFIAVTPSDKGTGNKAIYLHEDIWPYVRLQCATQENITKPYTLGIVGLEDRPFVLDNRENGVVSTYVSRKPNLSQLVQQREGRDAVAQDGKSSTDSDINSQWNDNIRVEINETNEEFEIGDLELTLKVFPTQSFTVLACQHPKSHKLLPALFTWNTYKIDVTKVLKGDHWSPKMVLEQLEMEATKKRRNVLENMTLFSFFCGLCIDDKTALQFRGIPLIVVRLVVGLAVASGPFLVRETLGSRTVIPPGIDDYSITWDPKYDSTSDTGESHDEEKVNVEATDATVAVPSSGESELFFAENGANNVPQEEFFDAFDNAPYPKD